MSKRFGALIHPRMLDASGLSRIAERLKRELGAEHVIVYGSVARGEATPDSDVDLLVIAPSTEKAFDRIDRARHAIRDLSQGLEISPLVLTPQEVQCRLEADDRFIRQIIDTGIEVGESDVSRGHDRLSSGRDARSRWGGVRPMPGARASTSWRQQAGRDWRRLQVHVRETDAPAAGLFLQQSLEKFLKGWLLDRGWELQKTHSLTALLDAASAHDPSLPNFRLLCGRVSSYYLGERYPDTRTRAPGMAQLRRDLDQARALVLALFPKERLE